MVSTGRWSVPFQNMVLPHCLVCVCVCGFSLQTTPNIALMWRPDLGKYNAFLMSKTDEPAQKGDHAGLTFPLPTPISNAFQVIRCQHRHAAADPRLAWFVHACRKLFCKCSQLSQANCMSPTKISTRNCGANLLELNGMSG